MEKNELWKRKRASSIVGGDNVEGRNTVRHVFHRQEKYGVVCVFNGGYKDAWEIGGKKLLKVAVKIPKKEVVEK